MIQWKTSHYRIWCISKSFPVLSPAQEIKRTLPADQGSIYEAQSWSAILLRKKFYSESGFKYSLVYFKVIMVFWSGNIASQLLRSIRFSLGVVWNIYFFWEYGIFSSFFFSYFSVLFFLRQKQTTTCSHSCDIFSSWIDFNKAQMVFNKYKHNIYFLSFSKYQI